MCDIEDGGCGHVFEVLMNRANYVAKQICPKCHQQQSVRRHYLADAVMSQSSPQTLGMLANKNSDKMSHEAKQAIIEKNRVKKTGPKVKLTNRK